MHPLRSTALAIALGSSLGLVGSASCATSGAASRPVPGPLDFSLPNVDEQAVTPESTQSHEVFVLAFWATWCQPCQQELSKMKAVYGDYRDRGLHVYAINIDGPSTSAQVGPWVEREGYTFPVLLDRETQVLTRYNPRGEIPYYVVLDAQGRILKDHQGYMTGDLGELESYLDATLPPG